MHWVLALGGLHVALHEALAGALTLFGVACVHSRASLVLAEHGAAKRQMLDAQLQANAEEQASQFHVLTTAEKVNTSSLAGSHA